MQVLTFVSAFTRVNPCAHIGTLADNATFADIGTFAQAGAQSGPSARSGAFARREAPQSLPRDADSPMGQSGDRTRSMHSVDDAVHDPGEF